MFLRLVIIKEPKKTAILYVWSEDKVITYKYHHNPELPNLLPHFGPINYSNDLYIDFKSDVPIETWLIKIRSSEFNSFWNHHLLHHNCAMGVVFALEMAGIFLFPDKNKSIMNVISLSPQFKLPLFTLTPYDVYLTAKSYKLNQVSLLTIPYKRAQHNLERASLSSQEKKINPRDCRRTR